MRNSISGRSRGFTLIELLVVVLIIGILAAVALPQYTKAVEKSRAVQMMTLAKSIGQALEIYYQANGTAPTSFDELDVDLPADWTGNEKIYNYGALDVRSNGEWSVVLEESSSIIGIHTGRLTGPFEGADFSYYVKSYGTIPSGKLLCGEVQSNSSHRFGKNAGDFCVKFFQGTSLGTSGIRLYTLP